MTRLVPLARARFSRPNGALFSCFNYVIEKRVERSLNFLLNEGGLFLIIHRGNDTAAAAEWKSVPCFGYYNFLEGNIMARNWFIVLRLLNKSGDGKVRIRR